MDKETRLDYALWLACERIANDSKATPSPMTAKQVYEQINYLTDLHFQVVQELPAENCSLEDKSRWAEAILSYPDEAEQEGKSDE